MPTDERTTVDGCTDVPETFPFPLCHRPERLRAMEWWAKEDRYITRKFDPEQRAKMDATLAVGDLDSHWYRSMTMYYDRAHLFCEAAFECAKEPGRSEEEFKLKQLALQALGKAMTTSLAFFESAQRAWDMAPPEGGISSGNLS